MSNWINKQVIQVGWNANDKWFFANITALQTAYPTGSDWWYAVLGSTDTFWVWDSGTTAWKNTDSSSIGDVVWPASSTDNAIARYDGTTGKIIQDSLVTITDAGLVGINTSPSFLIDGIRTAAGSVMRLRNSSSAHGGFTVQADTNGAYIGNGVGGAFKESIYFQDSINAIRLFTNASERVRVDVNGNVGIGVAPSTPLDVVGSSSGDLLVQAQNTNANGISSFVAKDNGGTRFLTFGVNNTTMSLGTQYGIAGEGIIRSSGSATGIAISASTWPIRFLQTSGGSERMRIDTAGNVGIWTPTPAFNLDVTGTARFGNSTLGVDFGSGAMRFIGTGPRLIYSGGYSSQIQIDGSSVALNTNSGGRTGIGVVSPTAVLHIKAGTATANTAPIKLTAGENLTTPENWAIEYDGSDAWITIWGVRQRLNNKAETIAAGSNITVTGTVSNPIVNAPTMTSTVGGAVPTPPNNTTTFLRGDGTFAIPAGGGSLTTQDEGVTLSTAVTTLNFTGAGVTASGAGWVTTINISGGWWGGTTKGIAEVDFGAIGQESDIATITVSDTSITTTSYPSANLYAIATTDHDPDDYMAEWLTAYITNIINGVSFDISVRAPSLTWGKYKVTYLY